MTENESKREQWSRTTLLFRKIMRSDEPCDGCDETPAYHFMRGVNVAAGEVGTNAFEFQTMALGGEEQGLPHGWDWHDELGGIFRNYSHASLCLRCYSHDGDLNKMYLDWQDMQRGEQ